MGNSSSSNAKELRNISRAQLNELIAECTCSICQDVYDQPVLLRCQHVFCTACINKLVRESPSVDLPPLLRMLAEGIELTVAKCPLCRAEVKTSDSSIPRALQENLFKLQVIKQNRCEEEGCWQVADRPCGQCGKRMCETHHQRQHDITRHMAQKVRDDVASFLHDGAMNQQMSDLIAQRENLPVLQQRFNEMVEQAMVHFDHQLGRTINELQVHQTQQEEQQQEMQQEVSKLDALIEKEEILKIEAQLQPQRERLRQLKSNTREQLTSQQLQLNDIQSAVGRVFGQLEPQTFIRAYEFHEDTQKATIQLATKHEIWDLDMLTNTANLVVANGLVQLRRNQSQSGANLRGPCLVVNYKGFPTKHLHLCDMAGKEVARIKISLESEGMAGRIRICNRQQLISVTDAGRHKVFILRFDGQLMYSFGSEGTEPNELDCPLGTFMHAGRLYVADSHNRRVQVYDAEENFRCVSSIKHKELSSDICAIHVSEEFIVVVDDDNSKISVFETATNAFVRVQQLEGDGFDIAVDRFGNIFASLPAEAKIQVLSPDCSQLLKTFDIEPKSGDTNVRRLNGLAIEPISGRVFCADSYGQRIFAFDL